MLSEIFIFICFLKLILIENKSWNIIFFYFHSEFDITYVIQFPFVLCRFILNLVFFWFETVTSDTQGQSHAEARSWSQEKILGGRAFHEDLKQI